MRFSSKPLNQDASRRTPAPKVFGSLADLSLESESDAKPLLPEDFRSIDLTAGGADGKGVDKLTLRFM